jgi:hypothetical protein
MPFSIGFDTLIINNRYYSEDDLSELFELFVPLGIKNFLFLFEFDLANTSFLRVNKKISLLKQLLSTLTPRGVHSSVKLELVFDSGAPFNSDLSRLYASRSGRSLFVALPIFPQTDDNVFATDLNRLLYRSGSFPIFTSFQNITETASTEFTSKLISTGAGFGFDLNYLLRTDRPELIQNLISNNTLILPMISHQLTNYVGIVNEISYFKEIYSKNEYYKLCSQINRCSSKVGF